jgi:hypothetical protein
MKNEIRLYIKQKGTKIPLNPHAMDFTNPSKPIPLRFGKQADTLQ